MHHFHHLLHLQMHPKLCKCIIFIICICKCIRNSVGPILCKCIRNSFGKLSTNNASQFHSGFESLFQKNFPSLFHFQTHPAAEIFKTDKDSASSSSSINCIALNATTFALFTAVAECKHRQSPANSRRQNFIAPSADPEIKKFSSGQSIA